MRISVVIPLYNKGELVKRAIDSVLSQQWDGEAEIIVVDDGSTDDSARYVHIYHDQRIRYVWQENAGVSAARNRGIENATADWLLFLDADDELKSGAFDFFRRLHEEAPKSRILIGAQEYGKHHVWHNKRITTTNYPMWHIWLNRFYPRPGAILVHREIISREGGFDERQSFYEDYEFGLRTIGDEQVTYSDYVTIRYNQSDAGLSATSHPMTCEMAYYIPERMSKKISFWERALLFENLEMEILWWQQHDNDQAVSFYSQMQRDYFGRIHWSLHWLHQQLLRHGWL